MTLRRLFLLFALLAVATAALAQQPAPPCDLRPVMPPSKDEAAFEKALYAFLEARCYDKPLNWARDKQLRDTGPYLLGNGFGTHPAVLIYYSKEAADWMAKPKDKRGEIPENAIIVKEMHSPPASANNSINGWTTMVRDSKGSWDGWYWSYHAPPSCGTSTTPACPPDLTNPAGRVSFPDSGFGNYCVNCHASADNTSSTFIDDRNIHGTPMTYLVVNPTLDDPTLEPKHITDLHARHAVDEPQHLAATLNPIDTDLLQHLAPGAVMKPYPDFPGETWDHVVSRARPQGPEQFITSDQCIGCHDATQNMAAPPNMIYPASGGDQFAAQFLNNYTAHDPTFNISPYGEWRASMMGLAGRDPVFFAQVASERSIHNQKDLPVTIQTLCFRCHGVMGKRQLDIDTGGKEQPFLSEYVLRWGSMPMAKYAALAREGISCAVCHHIAADGLGKPETFTGLFKTGPANEINGPFEKPPTLPMDQSLGMKPVQVAQIKSSALCGSCHAINLPIYDSKGNQVGSEYEQATYLEWLNSVYQNEIKPFGSDPKTCQDCHMPTNFKMKGFESQDLAYRIASIEDDTFPFVDNRAPDADITLPVRAPYSRHMLSSMNLFVLKMFEQFSGTLGIRTSDPMATFGAPVSGLTLAKASGTQLAHEQTAKVEILSATKTATTLDVKVHITNLAGHAFPSGVSFRRAFIDFALLDAAGNSLWESGATNRYGIITEGANGPILPTEFLERGADGKQQYQPHYQTITKQSQVQIYEELAKNTDGVFTTSFVALFERVKLNRLQPKGWRKDGPYAHDTAPDANTAKDPDYSNGSGADTILYSIPLADLKGTAATASATVFYQAIPPYYLRQRFTDSDFPDTSRLMDFVAKLNVAKSEISDWKLRVAGARRPVS